MVFPFAVFYFTYFFLIATQLAFIPVHCNLLGFSSLELAVVTSNPNVGVLIGAPLTMSIARRWIPARTLLPILLISGAAASGALMLVSSFEGVLAGFLVAATCCAGAGTLVDYEAAHNQGEKGAQFERVRLWGSIGFMAGAFILGQLIDRIGDGLIIPTYSVFFLLTFFACFAVRPKLSSTPYHSLAIIKSLGPFPWRAFAPLLVTVLFQWASIATLYIFLSIHLKSLGWSATLVSSAWNFGVLCELVVFLSFPFLRARTSLRFLLQMSIAFTIVRWILLGTTTSMPLIFLAQGLHAFTFGMFFLSSLHMLRELLPKDHLPRGQGMWASAGMGAGLILGRLLMGALAVNASTQMSIQGLFLISAAIACGGLMTSFALRVRRAEPPLGV